MSFTKDIFKNQSPWGSGGPSRGSDNGSGSRREPPSLDELIGKLQREGLTIIPTKMYFKKGKAKIEIAVAKGKKKYDKREAKKKRDWNRDKSRYIRKSS